MNDTVRKAAIYFNDIYAGILYDRTPLEGYRFEYDAQYLISPNPPVSITLPKTRKIYISEIFFPFFSSILPEGHNRAVICQIKKIDEDDLFGLLMAMRDKDFVGAVNIRTINE